MSSWAIRDATVIDGSGTPAFRADVGIVDGRIAIGTTPADARVVEAAGRVLCPGFIDMHAHSDVALLDHPEHTAKVTQGVTLEVLGQDGLSYAPCDDAARGVLHEQLAGWNGEVETHWDTVADYLDRIDRGVAVNAGYLVPQGTLRLMVVGPDDRPATDAEVDRMTELLRQGLADGALGMSSGLTYPPGMYADDDELAALLRVVAEHGGYYSPHHRSYGAGAIEAYAEMVRLGEETGCPLHLTHATLNFEPNRGRAQELLDLVDAALARGVDITLDSYPYLAGSTTLAALLPGWASSGGPGGVLERLAVPEQRARIRHALEVTGSDGCHGCVVDWDTVEISGVRDPALAHRVGERVTGFDDFVELLVADRLGTTIRQHVGDEANVRAIMAHRVHCGGSDAILVGDRPHPRAWGTFPRYLGHYVRDVGVLGLVDCVRHLTGRPAARLGLTERGLVRDGFAADLVLLDPATVRDTATYDDPRQQCEGVDMVWVSGEAVVDTGVRTDALPGRAIRRTAEGGAA